MSTVWKSLADNASYSLAAPYAPGSGALTLVARSGADLAARVAAAGFPPVSPAAPLRFTLVSAAAVDGAGRIVDPARLCVYTATGRAGDTLSGVVPDPNETDRAFAPGDVLGIGATARQFQELQSALAALQAQGSAGDLTFTFTQGAPAAVWAITHNLGKFPAVTVVDSAGNECEGDVRHLSSAALVVTFSAGFSGTAYLN